MQELVLFSQIPREKTVLFVNGRIYTFKMKCLSLKNYGKILQSLYYNEKFKSVVRRSELSKDIPIVLEELSIRNPDTNKEIGRVAPVFNFKGVEKYGIYENVNIEVDLQLMISKLINLSHVCNVN